MELSQTPPLMLLLISVIHFGHAQERPKAVAIEEAGGNGTITVRCEIAGSEDDWTYSWLKEGSNVPFSTGREIKIQANGSHSIGNITCRGERKHDGQMSEISDAVTQNKPKVAVDPQSAVFAGDSVTLSCDVRRSKGQTIAWYKNNKIIKAPVKGTPVKFSDGGMYACAILGITIQSPGVKLTVTKRPKPVLRVRPDGQIFTGETVTLTCDIQHSDVTSWNYSLSKDDSVIHVSESQEYTISSVNESHTGRYSCTGRETGGSRYSHTSDQLTLTVSASGSSGFRALVIGVTTGLSAAFLLVFLMLLHCCCKHNKASDEAEAVHHQHNISQTSKQRKTEHTDTAVGFSHLTYAMIDLKSQIEMKKINENKGKSREGPRTVYTKLKMATGGAQC